jgi:UPF0755 protein
MEPLESPFLSFLRNYTKTLVSFFLIIACCIIGFGYVIVFKAPKNFPNPALITVKSGTPLGEIAQELKEANYIRSPFFFTVATVLLGGEKGVRSGDYFFAAPANTLVLADRLTQGDFKLTPIKVTVPEGTTISGMAMILMRDIPGFEGARFAAMAKDKEGFLFPDTYLFLPNVTAEIVIKAMEENFARKIKPLNISAKNLEPTIIMASILEEEGNTAESRRIMSGILAKRLKEGMPLQVDAPFAYAIGKSTYDLTLDDLKINSPYNTYNRKGLPPTPISNPGLDSIKAALEPTPSPYYFYLTERNGTVHYARTYAEHLANKEKYVK